MPQLIILIHDKIALKILLFGQRKRRIQFYHCFLFFIFDETAPGLYISPTASFDHQVDPYHTKHTHRLGIWTRGPEPERCARHSMGTFSADCPVWLMVVERALGKEMVQEKKQVEP